MSARSWWIAAAAGLVVLVMLGWSLMHSREEFAAPGGATPQIAVPEMDKAGGWLVQTARQMEGGGIAWRSAIQAPHYQTDRDVGAAGTVYGLLALVDTTRDGRLRTQYLTAARQAADFLVEAQSHGVPGRWPDYVDPDEVATKAFTSFDDGAAGIADVLWLMWERTGEESYRKASLAGIDWLISKAEDAGGENCPKVCRWAYNDDDKPSYHNGMGQGQAGIVYALATFAERTGVDRYREYAGGGAAYLKRQLHEDGGMPESSTDAGRNTGYLSGTAGAAFVFLRMYQATRDNQWSNAAERALRFLDRTAVVKDGKPSWPTMLDEDGTEINPDRATGMEEGAAGIGWVYLQAYAVTGDKHYLDQARSAGEWLLAAAHHEHGGSAWPEYLGSAKVHSGLNSGVAGIGWFLFDLHLATGDTAFLYAARSAQTWLTTTTKDSDAGTYWNGSRDGAEWLYSGEPSWHWGGAGIAAFFARMAGWPVDSPGMQPGLVEGRAR